MKMYISSLLKFNDFPASRVSFRGGGSYTVRMKRLNISSSKLRNISLWGGYLVGWFALDFQAMSWRAVKLEGIPPARHIAKPSAGNLLAADKKKQSLGEERLVH